MNKKKTFIVWCLIVALAFGNDISVFAMEEDGTIPMLPEDYAGYVEVPDETFSIHEGTEILRGTEKDIPSRYDSREKGVVTSVKNQNPWESCWSFATMAALESSLIRQGLYTDIDLSEYHLIDHTFFGVEDPLGGTAEDSVQFNGTHGQAMNGGGNVLVAYHALTNWIGAVEESRARYPGGEAEIEALPATVENAYLDDVVHLQQFYKISRKDVNEVKKAIMEYGAVTAAVYYSQRYLNNTTGGYYQKIYENTNHAITIVGWDDHFSKDNFSTAPSSDGAWLVKNSWGTGNGLDGFFWLSYEEKSLGDAICVLVAEPADNYDNNYQYDGSYYPKYIYGDNYIEVANEFRIQSGENKEALRAVSFDLYSTNTEYSIQIYKQLTKESDPTSGEALLEQPVVGKTRFQGYYTIRLPEEIMLNPEEIFSVVITFTKDARIGVGREDTNEWNNIKFTAGAKNNQSFYRLDNRDSWTDMAEEEYHANLRIKAFTKNTEEPADTKVSGVTGEEKVQLHVGEQVKLNAVVYPETATNKQVLWESGDDEIATVDAEGNVTAHKKGTTTVTCTTEDGGYTWETQVIVNNVVSIVGESAEVLVGETIQLLLSINGELQDASRNADYNWHLDWDQDAVDISPEGELTGLLVGEATVICENREDPTETAIYEVKVPIPFTDIRRTDWYYPYVADVYEDGIMSGKSQEIFDPNGSLTRAEFVTVLYSYTGRPQVTYTQQFSDVIEDGWYAPAVTWAKDTGVAAGFGNGCFGVSSKITREQLVTMLYAYSGKYAPDTLGKTKPLDGFTDKETVSSWAVEAFEWAIANQIIVGKPVNGELRLDPLGNTTRGECATMMKKYGDRLE